MSDSPWDPAPAPAHDPLADLVTGLVSRARAARALLDAIAPPVGEAPSLASAPPSADTLALLGLLSICARVERVFGALPPVATSPPAHAPAEGGSLLR